MVKLFERTQEMRHGTRETIESGHNDDIKAARSRIFHQLIECGPRILRAADSFVAIFLHDRKVTMGGILTQSQGLSFCRLPMTLCADSHVEGCTFHCCPL